ncbi:glutaminase A [Pseudooceanicola sp. LIPI14-2-Ac024]|uniref:glutaminase A n=1 Tax=Pseudooceanicola sp. LIPI14-2-Ac024 TaxID=3344875 RepID=UPI0035CF7346
MDTGTSDPVRAEKTVLGNYLDRVLRDLKGCDEGEVATYIPELGRADPSDFGIAVATADGRLYRSGTWDREVTIQSASKPFMYAAALANLGREALLEKVGVEPTGERYNAIVLDEENNRAFNPMVNSGAIVTASLLANRTAKENAEAMLTRFSRLAGRQLSIDNSVFWSEHDTGHRNRAIAWLMLNSGIIERDPEIVLDLYFRQCSVLVNCADLAVMACTLGTLGRQPVTGDVVLPADVARDVLSVMTTCGMYDYAGQWLYDVGLPAKSGVSGLIMAVVPGQLGIAVYSPRLDAIGNSVRGVEVCKRFAGDFGLHACVNPFDPGAAIRRVYSAREVRSRRQRNSDERAMLVAGGGAMKVIELDGPLVFGSAERVATRVRDEAQTARRVVVDLRRVDGIDPAARRLLSEVPRTIGTGDCRVLFTGLTGTRTADGAEEMVQAIVEADAEDALAFADIDAAIEDFEDRLLAAADAGGADKGFSLARSEIFRGLAPDEIALLEAAASTHSYAEGDYIVTHGAEAKAFYLVASGLVSITIPAGDGSTRRISTVGPGQTFGEMAMLDGGPRSASAVATGPVICHAFAIEAIRDIAAERPQVYSVILGNVVHSISDRLRAANEQIGAFE